jgi:glyoxylase-like metal-dependent hydrolase (beta-lactamase superfamily II)
LERHGEGNLRQAQQETPELSDVRLCLPNIVFDKGNLFLRAGDRVLELIHTPGHTADSMVVYDHQDRLLFAGDTMMPVPYIVWGNWQTLAETLARLAKMRLDNIVQGHGEVLLRGEIPGTIRSSIAYLTRIHERVSAHVEKGGQREQLKNWGLERFGLSRLPLAGLAPQLHQANLLALYDELSQQAAADADV